MFVVLFIYLAFCKAINATSFMYSIPNYTGIVGEAIKTNSPKEKMIGTFTSNLDIPGIELDKRTGIISGIPLKAYNGFITVTYVEGNSERASTQIHLTILGKASTLSCGISKLVSPEEISATFTCKTDIDVNYYSTEPDFETIDISKSGLLEFKRFKENAHSDAGHISTNITIIIDEENSLTKGLWSTVTVYATFDCGSPPKLEQKKESMFWIDAEDLDTATTYVEGYNMWNKKMKNKFYSYFLQYELWSYINVTESDVYTFIYKIDSQSGTIYINDNKIVDRSDKCYRWDDEDNMIGKVALEPGLNKFYAKGLVSAYINKEMKGLMNVRFRYYTDKDTTEREIPFVYYSKEFIPFKDLSTDSYKHYLITGLDISITLNADSNALKSGFKCESNIPLPEGLEFVDNKIVGKAKSTQSEVNYDIYCYNGNSVSNTITITIAVTDELRQGVVGYYMKVDNFDVTCYNYYDSSKDGVSTEFIRIDKSITHESTTEDIAWDGLTSNFASEYAVNWLGYLKTDKTIASIELFSYDGSWFITKQKSIYNYGRHSYKGVNNSVTFEPGLYEVRIAYSKYKGGSGIKATVKFEGQNEIEDISKYLYYIPNGDFEYTYQTTSYTVGKGITSNNPILIGEVNVIKYNCTNIGGLPKGLELDQESGIITGTPEEEQDKKEYTITLECENNRILETTIYIKVIGDLTPDGFHFIDTSTAEEVTEIIFSLGVSYKYLLAQTTGYVVEFDIKDIPEGFSFNKDSNYLEGSTSIEKGDYEMTIVAKLVDGTTMERKMSYKVVSLCTGNENEKYHSFRLVSGYYSGNVIMSYENNVEIFNQDIYSSSFQYNIGCIEPTNFILSFNVPYPEDTVWHVYTDGIVANIISLSSREKEKALTITSKPQNPILEYETKDIVLYYDDKSVNIVPSLNGTFVTSCKIEPTLIPTSLEFSSNDCSIKGYVSNPVEMKSYKVTATNSFGDVSIDLNITISDVTVMDGCELEGKVYLHIHFTTLNYNIYFVLYDENERTIFTFENDYYTTDYYMCVNQGIYTSVRDGGYNEWGDSSVILYMFNIPLGSYTCSYDDFFVSESHYMYYLFGANTEWSYSYEYTQGWNLPNTVDGWKKAKLRDIQVPDNENTLYLRLLHRFENIDDYTAFYLRINYISGVIIYVNGQEYYRENVGDGDVSHGSYATNILDTMTMSRFVIPIEVLNFTTSSISIELHKYQTEKEFPQIKFLFNVFQGDNDEDGCTILNLYADEITEYDDGNEYSSVKNGFDVSQSTLWYFNQIPTYAIMNFQHNTHIYFNQLTLYAYETDSQWTSSLTEFVLSGKHDNTWKDLATLSDITYTDNVAAFPNYNLSTMYESLKVNITQRSNDKEVNIRGFLFNLCPIRFCNAIELFGLPKTACGNTVIVPCGNPEDGNKTFYCPISKHPQWDQISGECKESPEFIESVERYEFEVGKYYSKVKLFSVSGVNIQYSMTPEIPGLILESPKGTISGKAYTPMFTTITTFKAVNAYKPEGITFTIKLSVKSTNLPVIYNVTSTSKITAGHEIKDLKLFYFIGNNIKITITNIPPGLSLAEDQNSLNGITYKEGEYNMSVKATNEYGTDTTDIIITVVLPDEPIIYKIEDDDIKWYYYENYSNIIPVQCIGKNISYSTQSKLPNGLELVSGNGEIRGTIKSKPAEFPVTIVCSNDKASVDATITIKVEISYYPIIISCNNKIVIDAGVEYKNYKICEISGLNFSYILSTNVPDYLTFDKTNGGLNGYVLKKHTSSKYTMLVNGGNKTYSHDFNIEYGEIKDKPVIVNSTVIHEKVFNEGESIDGFKLFDFVSSNNVEITVIPSLPPGIKCDSKSAMIYGSATEYVNGQYYEFYVKNMDSGIAVSQSIYLEFKTMFCEADSGFAKTVAVVGGKTIVKKCGGSKSGFESRTCYLLDNGVKWSEITSDCKMESGVIVGIVVGSVVGVGLIVFVIVLCILRGSLVREKSRKNNTQQSEIRL